MGEEETVMQQAFRQSAMRAARGKKSLRAEEIFGELYTRRQEATRRALTNFEAGQRVSAINEYTGEALMGEVLEVSTGVGSMAPPGVKVAWDGIGTLHEDPVDLTVLE